MLHWKPRDSLIGKKFAFLKVITFSHRPKSKDSYWKCECICNKLTVIRASHLISGDIKSCGCKRLEQQKLKMTKHGGWLNGKPTVEYATWSSMKQRCTNSHNQRWENYGKRGIKVCNEWFNSYPHFLKDMGKRPGKEYSLDRMDNDGNYEPSNCRWATAKQQANNRQNNLNRGTKQF